MNRGFSLLITAAIAAVHTAAAAGNSFVSVQDGRFVDPEGRQILFHGMSVINKSKGEGYVYWQKPQDFAQMRQWGMNCIRLGILWDGVEPEPGHFGESYLKMIDERIQWAKEHGIYVFLDMHQDLFSVLYSDGAPEWATLIDGAAHVKAGGVWSDAYFSSPAVQNAFDNFWRNTPAADGLGLQDHFAQAWRHLAERYAHEPAVIGYDLFNEPNMGGKSPLAQLAMINQFARLLREKVGETAPDVTALIQMWSTALGRSKLMEYLKDMDLYAATLDAVTLFYADFERSQLMSMYQRVANAIREVDLNHILFLETSMASNMGVRSAIEPVSGPGGKRDPLQAYAPHGYDIVVDTPDQANASFDRIALIFDRHAETAQRLQMPMLVGEWGAYGGAGADILPAARAVVRQFERHLCSETYWEYGKYVSNSAYQEVLQRPIPLHVNGALREYQSDPEQHVFRCVWQENAALTAPTIIFLPKAYTQISPKLTPEGNGFETQSSGDNGSGVFLSVPPLGTSQERQLIIHP